jgi:dolichyl-phosphate-mannose-protein mannosyltransferase
VVSSNMATARTTGADAQAEELRRRNVAGQPASPVVSQAQIKEKSKEKVRALQRDFERIYS